MGVFRSLICFSLFLVSFSSVGNTETTKLCYSNALQISVHDGPAQFALKDKAGRSIALPKNSQSILKSKTLNQVVHLSGPCTTSDTSVEFEKLNKVIWIKDQSEFLFSYRQPQFNQTILGIEPTSLRALEFSKHYQKISDHFHGYLGEPKVITSLAFESHVVQDVAKNLKDLEEALALASAFRKFGRFDFSESKQFYRGLAKINRNQLGASLIYGLRPFLVNAPWNWGWHHLDQIINELWGLHENMSAMNMHIFSYMTSKDAAIETFFREAKNQGQWFNGKVDFHSDVNGILKEAFYNLYLAAQTENLLEKKQLSYNFSILLIAYEQIQAQVYYDQIHRQHQILAGQFRVFDPIGRYKLIKKPWSLFQVRFSINLDNIDPQFELSSLTPTTILENSLSRGTIPHYYFSRIFHKDALKMLEKPDSWSNWSNTITSNAPNEKETSRGESIFKEYGCNGCHQIEGHGGVVGPDLTQISRFLTRSEITQAITDPNRVISTRCSEGPCPSDIMPEGYGELLSEDELLELTDYLNSLK